MGRRAIITGCLLTMTIFSLTACNGAEGQEPTPTPEIVQTEPTSEELSTAVNESEEAETAEPETTETVDPEIIVAAGPAADLVEDIVLGWNLGNTLDSCSGAELGKNEGLSSETAWGNPRATQEMIDLVKDNGINAVRVPVTWYNHMDSDYVIDEEWMDRVQEVVDYVMNDDMYCIINVHHDTGANGWLRASDTNLEENKAMFAAIWEQVSARFAGYNEHLLFEGFNEILNDTNEWVNPDSRAVEVVNELNQLFVDTVRASGGNNGERILIVNTYCAGGNSQVTKDFVLPTDSVENSLVVEAHIYQPYKFTAEEYPETVKWNKESVDSYLKNMYVSFVQKGIPVIVGEFGCADKDNDGARQAWAKYYVETCTDYGIKCFWWDNGSAYRLFNRRNLKISEVNLLGTMVAAAKGEEYVPQAAEEEDPDDNMCADVDKWTGWVNSGAKATITYLQDGVSIEVTESGDEEWYIQGTYAGLTLEKGVSYEISFDYSATTDITLPFHFQQNYEPYGVYASGSADYTTEKQHYSNVFTMNEDTDNNVALVFNCGKREEKVPFTMTVTNLRIVRIEE
ncbi:MAG: cellulase family glycosylhydrolase [Acetatifactor sp.]|nr:cellulase family glycosylhydrolase [Acetatifactor sp.]